MVTSVCLKITFKSVVALIVVSAFVQIFPGKNSASFRGSPLSAVNVQVRIGDHGQILGGGRERFRSREWRPQDRRRDLLFLPPSWQERSNVGGNGWTGVTSALTVTDTRLCLRVHLMKKTKLAADWGYSPRTEYSKPSTALKLLPVTCKHKWKSRDLPGCALAFDSEGVAVNACDHAGKEAEMLTLLRC